MELIEHNDQVKTTFNFLLKSGTEHIFVAYTL